jgi:hypothetical protein
MNNYYNKKYKKKYLTLFGGYHGHTTNDFDKYNIKIKIDG